MAGHATPTRLRLVWGTLGVLATLFGVMAGPKVIVDNHELMCGWSPIWQRLAGLLGDCAPYVQKLRTEIIVVPGSAPAERLPQKEVYARQRKQFLAAAHDRDEQFVGYLKREGFRAREEDTCSIIEDLASGRTVAASAVDLVMESVPPKFRCQSRAILSDKREAVPIDRALLDRALPWFICGIPEPSNYVGLMVKNGATQARATTIERVVMKQGGPSPELRAAAKRYAQMLERVRRLTKDDVVASCIASTNDERGIPAAFTGRCLEARAGAVTQIGYGEPTSKLFKSACERELVKGPWTMDLKGLPELFERWAR
jgi:hypothetical protein